MGIQVVNFSVTSCSYNQSNLNFCLFVCEVCLKKKNDPIVVENCSEKNIGNVKKNQTDHG